MSDQPQLVPIEQHQLMQASEGPSGIQQAPEFQADSTQRNGEPRGPVQHRVYISNLSQETTEEALLEFLKAYSPVSVLIPSQSVRGFQKSQVKPLGIAYAEFKDSETAAKVILELNGVTFMNRELRLRYHIPFKSDKEKLARGPNKLRQIQRRLSELRKRNVDILRGRSDSGASQVPVLDPAPRETSKVTVYVGRLPGKTTDQALRQFFNEYAPQEIIVFKHRQFSGWRIRRHVTAAVVTFPDHERQQAVLDNLAQVQFNGRTIILAAAFEDKLAEIRAEVQRMAVEQQLPQPASNLGIYIGNNLIAMQPLQPGVAQEQMSSQTQPQVQSQEQPEEQPANAPPYQQLVQAQALQPLQPPKSLLPLNPVENSQPVQGLDLALPQEHEEVSRAQPLLRLQKLQMIQRLQRLHRQKQRQQLTQKNEQPQQPQQQLTSSEQPSYQSTHDTQQTVVSQDSQVLETPIAAGA